MSVRLDIRAREALSIEARRRRRRETGGALFGFLDGEDVVVACAYGPGPRARHRARSFEPHRGTTEGLMAAVRATSKQRYRFLGSWHTHPGGVAVPSGRDTQTAAEIAGHAEVLLPSPLLIIQATRPKVRGSELAELAAWRWDAAGELMLLEPIEPIELEERWCPELPGAGRCDSSNTG